MSQIRFGAKWLAFILTYALAIFHCITLCSRIARRRLVSSKHPTSYIIRRFLSRCAEDDAAANARANAVATPTRPRRCWFRQTPVAVLIEWLDFSSDIKAVDNSTRALFKAARVLAKINSRRVSDVLGQCRGISGTTLKRARVHLDSVAMLLYRMLFRSLPDMIGIYMWIDSSPQLMGCEMFAASFEVFDPTGQFPCVRKPMPVIYLNKSTWILSARLLPTSG